MSEYINNVSRRKEIIKNVLKQLHEGKPLDDVKKEFSELLIDVKGAEITTIEQMLIDEGLPVSEIQRLCDVHTAVFRESLDHQESPESLPGHPVYTFLDENRAAAQLLNDLKQALANLSDHPGEDTLSPVKNLAEKLLTFEKHFVRKENLLFPYLERYNFSGPTKVMWGIQNDIRSAWKTFYKLVEKSHGDNWSEFVRQLEETFALLENTMKEMFYKEEKILLPAALERLKTEDWLAIRKQEEEIGYVFVSVGNQWPSQTKTQPALVVETKPSQEKEAKPQTTPVMSANMVALNTGVLTARQINIMLKSLPVDVSYVDENDTVRYYSETRQRVFPRSPAIIGRKVQNCHPPQSVGRVQKILDDFRTGIKDEVEFWIQMQGRFIYIQYFAMRDNDGAYRGALEVTQDATHLRSLQGEQRLLND